MGCKKGGKKRLVLVGGLILFAVVTLAGCTYQQHEAMANGAGQVQLTAEKVKEIVSSETAKTVSGVLTGLPVPGVQVVEPARVSVEWLAGGVAALAGLVAAWQKRKADVTKKERIEMQRVIDDQAQIDAAFDKAHGKGK